MAQYKVPQNVESEDKIIGPLSLRQFIYVIIAIMWAVLMWRLFISAPVIIIVTSLPVTGLFLALGLIQREEQSFENYFIAIIRFLIVPRKRVWRKEELSKAEATPPPPKPKPAPQFGQKNPVEVRGQLEKLALIVDTRGRAPKSSSIQLPDEQNAAAAMSARINVSESETSHQQAPQVTQEDDILDMQHNTAALAVGQMLEKAENDVKTQAKEVMQNPSQNQNPPATQQPAPKMQQDNQDAILDVAANSGDLSVAQVAAQANRIAASGDQLIENQSVKLR